MVLVEGVGLDSAELPFDGAQRSGFGREPGHLGTGQFVNKKHPRRLLTLEARI